MALEETANSIEDHLIEGLSFKLKPGASYVQSRRSVSFFPQGGNSYSSNGVKVIKISLNGAQGEWLDPSTLVFSFVVNNDNAGAQRQLKFLSGPWSLFRRMRITCGGTIIEDVDSYARCHEIFHLLGSSAVRQNASVMGFNSNSYNNTATRDEFFPISLEPHDYIGITTTKCVLFKPLSGLLNSDKYLPLRYMGGLTLEFELVSDPTEPLISEAYTWPARAEQAKTTLTRFEAAQPEVELIKEHDISVVWSLSEVKCQCDVITLDNNLNDEYVKYLLSGKTLAINYNTYVSQMQTVVNQQNSVHITRSLSRLKSIFISHVGDISNDATARLLHKEFNTFYHPMKTVTDNTYDPAKEFEWQIQIGSRLYPEYSVRSNSESYYQLLKCLGILSSAFHSIDIAGRDYRRLKFIIGLDLERVLGAGFTGINTKAGDLLTINTKSLALENNPTRMHVILHADAILNISDSGVSVFE